MRLLLLLCVACGSSVKSQDPADASQDAADADASQEPADACVPGTGTASVLAGSWLGVPSPPSDFGVNLDLQGTPDAICGVATHWAGGADAGYPTSVAGTERRLEFDGAVYWVPPPPDSNHFSAKPDNGGQLNFTRR